MQILHSLFGLACLLGIGWLLSESRRDVQWRVVGSGLTLASVLAAVFILFPGVQQVLGWMNGGLDALAAATERGTAFVFGFLGGGAPPYEVKNPAASFVLAFRALPLVLIVAALSALLFHWQVLPAIVGAFAWMLKRTMGIGGAVGVSAAANVFVGMVEAPLVIKPYLARLSRGELFIVMNCGMATIAGTVLVLYATVLQPVVPNALGHLLVASFVATPMAIVIAALVVPSPPGDDAHIRFRREDPSAMAALTRGTYEGLQLLLNIVAMLLVFVALVALANMLLDLVPAVGSTPLTLERLFGWVFAPLAWLTGVPWNEAAVAGQLLGKKTVLNELVAYFELARLPAEQMSARSRLLMTYALCGFANFGSLGIMLGGLTPLLPLERRADLAQLGVKSIGAGLLTTCATAALIGVFV
jgi:CNT family concentrative nucleoside transporter